MSEMPKADDWVTHAHLRQARRNLRKPPINWFGAVAVGFNFMIWITIFALVGALP